MNTPGNSSISQNIFHSGGYFGQRGSKTSSKGTSITNMQGSAAQSTPMDGKPFAAPSINNVFSEGSTTKFKNKQSHNRSNKQTSNIFVNRKKIDSVGSKPVRDIFSINQSEEAYDTSSAHQSSKIPYARNKGPTPITNVFGIPSEGQPRTSNIKSLSSSVNIFSSSQPFQNQNTTNHVGNTVNKSSNAFIPAIHNNEYYAKTQAGASFSTHLSDSKNDSRSSKPSSNLSSKFNVFAAASQVHTSRLEGQKSLRDVSSDAKIGPKSHYHQINQQVEHNKRVIFMQPIPSSLCNSDNISSYFAGENIQPKAILCEKDKKCAHVIFKSSEDAHKAIRITQPLFPRGSGLKLKWDFKQSWTAAELHNAQSSNRNYPDESRKDANKEKWKDFEQQRQYHEDISFADSDEEQQEQFEDDTSIYNHQQPANSSGDVSSCQPYDDIPIDNSVSSQPSSYASQDVSRMSQPDENSGSVSSRSSPFNQTRDANNKQELLGGELKPWEVVPTGIHDIFSRSSDLRDISSAKYVPIVGWPVLGPGLVGSCIDMCPAAEREFRVRTNDIQRFERPRITQENGSMTVCGRHLRDLLVKRHQRSAAGIMGTGMDFISAGEGSPHEADGEVGERSQKGQTSSDGVRHPVALAATCDYLFSKEFLHADINGIQYLRELENNPHQKWPYPFEWDEPQTPPTFQELHEFLFNRTRSIRRDFSTQNFHYKGRNDPLVIDIHERIARYHAMASYELCESQDFQRKLNDTELNNTLKTLNELYDDAYDRAKDAANQAYRRGTFDSFAVAFESLPRIASPHEAEMRSLYLLVHCLAVNDWAAQKSFLQKLPAHIVRSPEVKLALRSMRAAYTNNLHAFVREMKAATSLQACVMFSHLRLLQRGTAIQIAYAMRVNAPNLSQLKQLLCASNRTEVIAILREQRLGLSTYATMEEQERNEQYDRNNMRMDDEMTGKDDSDAMDEYDHAIQDDSVLTYLRLVRGRPRPEVVQTPGRLFKRPDLLSQVETYVLNDRSTFVCGDRWSYRSIVESMPIYGESHMQIGPGIKQVAKMHHLPSEKSESEYPRIARQTKSERATSTSARLQTKEAPLHTSYATSVPVTKSYIESPAHVLNHTDQTVPLLSSPVEPAQSQAPPTESVYHSDKIKESTSLRSSILPPSPAISIPCSTAAMPLSQASATTQPPITLVGTVPVSSESMIADVSTTSAISAERAPLISHITPSISIKSEKSLIVSSTPKPALFERNVAMFEPSVPDLISTTALTSSANIVHSTKSSGTPTIPFAASLLSKESGLLRSNEPLPSSTIQLDDSKLPRQFSRAESEAATSIKLEPWDAGSVGSQYSSSTQTPSHVIEHKPQARLIDDQQLSEIYEKMPGVKRRKIQRDLTEWQPSQVLLDFDKIQEGMGASLLDKMVQKPAVLLATQQLRALWSDSTLSSPFGNVPWDCLMDYANVCRSIRVLFVPTAVSSTHSNLEKKVDTAIGLVVDWMTWQSLAHVHWDHFEIYCQRRAAGSLGNMANVELVDGRVTLTHDVSSSRQIEENQELVVVKNFTIHSRAHLDDFLRAKSWSENAFVCVCVLWYLGNEPLDQMDKVLREQQHDSINNHVSFILTTLTSSSFDQFPIDFTDGMIEKLNRRISSNVTTANRSPPCMQPSDSYCSLPQALTCIADIFAHVDQCNTVEETIEYWNRLVADPTLPTDNMNTTEQQFLLSFCILKQSNDIAHVESLHQLEQIWLSLTFGTVYPEHGTLYPSLSEAGEAFRAKLQPRLTSLIEEHTSWPECFATIIQEMVSRMRIVFKQPIETMFSLSECTSIAKNRMAVLSTFQPPTELGDVITSEGLEQESCLESLLSTTGKDRVSTREFTKLRPKVPPRSLIRSKRTSLSVRTLEKLLADEIVNTQRFSKLLSQ